MAHIDGPNSRDTVLDFRMVTSLSSAVAIDWAPSGTRFVQIEAEDQPIRVREDNTAPTNVSGRLLNPGDSITLYPQPGDIAKIKIIETTPSAKVSVTCYALGEPTMADIIRSAKYPSNPTFTGASVSNRRP